MVNVDDKSNLLHGCAGLFQVPHRFTCHVHTPQISLVYLNNVIFTEFALLEPVACPLSYITSWLVESGIRLHNNNKPKALPCTYHLCLPWQ